MEVVAADSAASDPRATDTLRVVYLLGAGATQGSVDFSGGSERLVMPGLIQRLLDRMREVYLNQFVDHDGIKHLVNEVVDDRTDFEHLMTFLEDAPSGAYRDLAHELKGVFSAVLRDALNSARRQTDEKHSNLYAALVDMHQVEGLDEDLRGFLTLNYDSFLEHAIEHGVGRAVDYGVQVGGMSPSEDLIPVLKLHGSFSWSDTLPLHLGEELGTGRWIPPGIRKAKAEYPFNAIWGAAQELLDCDILRIIGCNLGANDWDLVSLIFSTMHARESAPPYQVEVVAWPGEAVDMDRKFPYLKARSVLELEDIGEQLVAEILGGAPTRFRDLTELDQERAISSAHQKIQNPFERWLRLKGEIMLRDLPAFDSHQGPFRAFIETSP